MERLNQWLTLVANFGVVIGIVFLAYEMRLNTDSMKSNTAAQSVAMWNAITMDAATDPDLLQDQLDVNTNGMKFDLPGLRLNYFASSMLKSTEFNFYEYLRGNMEQELWDAHVAANRGYFVINPFIIEAWANQRAAYGKSYRDFMDDLIRDICSKQECPEGGRPEDWTDLAT